MKTKPSNIHWYQLPLAWLGIAFFAASLVGCFCMVLLAMQYPDEQAPAADPLFKMPAAREPESRALEHRP
jgi:hypothetical protein